VHSVVDLDDWGYHYGPGVLALAAQFKSQYAAWLAKRQLKRFDAYFFVNRRDQAQHRELKSALLPNTPYTPPAQPFPQTNSPVLLFVGSLWYAPNREGIDRFLTRCWPAIKSAHPEARLLLVGAAPPAVRQAWEQYPDVSAPGFVDDLGEAYRNAAFTIAPIYSGGGTNIKILESLAYGRACITTLHSAEAFKEDLGAQAWELPGTTDILPSNASPGWKIAMTGDATRKRAGTRSRHATRVPTLSSKSHNFARHSS